MLDGKPDWLQVFYDRWNKSWNFGKSVVIFDNPEITYGYKDFDEYLLEDKDFQTLTTWALQLNLIPAAQIVLFSTPGAIHKTEMITLFKDIAAKKKNPYQQLRA
jgi:hypothetical protein